MMLVRKRFLPWKLGENGLKLQETLVLNSTMTANPRDAEYMVECLRMILQEESGAERLTLCLESDGISGAAAIDIVRGFLHETTTPSCLLQSLSLCGLCRLGKCADYWQICAPTDPSIKRFCIYSLQDHQGALWIADLLHHKTRFYRILHLRMPLFPFTQILPCLRGQPHLQELKLAFCCIRNHFSLFHDPECTQLFVDNVLLAPSANNLKRLLVVDCGMTMDNQPLLTGLLKNISLLFTLGLSKKLIVSIFPLLYALFTWLTFLVCTPRTLGG
jgi:hypothetical protein